MYEIYAKQVGANVIKTDSSQHNLKEFSKHTKTWSRCNIPLFTK